MKKQERVHTDFVSDDGKIGVLIERDNTDVISLILAFKNVTPKYEITAEQLQQLAEVCTQASVYLTNLKTVPAPISGQIG